MMTKEKYFNAVEAQTNSWVSEKGKLAGNIEWQHHLSR